MYRSATVYTKTKSENLIGKNRTHTYSHSPYINYFFFNARNDLRITIATNSLLFVRKHIFRSNHFVGKVIDGHLDDRFAQVYVSTEENVVAALSADTGAIVWRQVLERGDRGTIKYLHLISDDSTNANSIRLNNKRDDDGSLITVTGTSVIVVRGWNVRTGNLAWEWIVTPKSAVESHWFLNGSILYQVVPSWQTSSAEVFEYNARTGQVVQSAARRISLQSFQASKCDFIKSYLVCSGSDEIVSIDLRTGTSASLAKTTSRQQAVAVSSKFVTIIRVVESTKCSFHSFYSRLKQLSASRINCTIFNQMLRIL